MLAEHLVASEVGCLLANAFEIKALAQAVLTLTAQLQAANVELTALREGLRPFAALGQQIGDGVIEGIIWKDDLVIEGARAYSNGKDHVLTVGDLRRAAALTRTETTDV